MCGTPNRAKIWLLKNLIMTFSVMDVTASASTHLEYRSTATIKNFLALDAGGKGPRILTPQVENGHAETIGDSFASGALEDLVNS